MELKDLGKEKFTSRDVASHLRKPVKAVSNDLRRLHHMGFLRRKRAKRFCLSKKGKLCYKGYEYNYSLSEQGRSYLRWMREQKPIEELAHIELTREVLDHLPQELKEKLLVCVAIRYSYGYKGPHRHFRLIDDEALSIAFLLSENQKLAKENYSLRNQISILHGLVGFYMGLATGLNERNEQLEQQNKEITSFALDLLRETRRTWRLIEVAMDIPPSIIEIHRGSRDLIANLLFMSLPEEKFIKAMELVSKLEKKGRAEVERKIDVVKAEINS